MFKRRIAQAPKGDAPLERSIVLRNTYGMHVRPAHLFAKLASGFDADVTVEKDGNAVSGKSIMGLMTLEAPHGAKLRLKATGPEAVLALDELESLIKRKFDIADE